MATDLQRVQVALSGSGVAGPGVMTFYGTTAPGGGLVAAVKAFVTVVANETPTGVSFTVPESGDLITAETGVISGTWTETGGGTIASGNTTGLVLGLGARVEWRCSGVLFGRHMRGRTFIVPMAKGAFDGSGHVDAGYSAPIVTAATQLISAAAGHLVIWSRPKPERQGKHGILPAQVGGVLPVVSATMPNLPTSLRSRRQ